MTNTNNDKSAALTREIRRLHTSCLYTSTSLFIWLRTLRILRIGFAVLPVIFGSLATWKFLIAQGQAVEPYTAVLAFLAGLLPTLYLALGLDDHLNKTTQLAGEYKNLEIRFRGLADTGPTKAFTAYESEFELLRERLERANAYAYTAPQWCFRSAQKQVDAGNYDFDQDKTA